MSIPNPLAQELAVLRQAEFIEDAARRAAIKGGARPLAVVLRTGAVRRRLGGIVITVGQRIHGPVVNPPTIARLQGSSPAGSSLRLF